MSVSDSSGAGDVKYPTWITNSILRLPHLEEDKAVRGGSDKARGVLLWNPFAEGCYVPGQAFRSCGQFSNLLFDMAHALAVARVLRRRLVLPGYMWRKVQ